MTMVSLVFARAMVKCRLPSLDDATIDGLLRECFKSRSVGFTEKGDTADFVRGSIDHPFGTGIAFVEFVDRDGLAKYLDVNFPAEGAAGAAVTASGNKGGRPRQIDWDAFFIEVIRIANTPDGLPPRQSELERIMAEWFVANGWSEPSHGTLGPKISRIYKALR